VVGGGLDGGAVLAAEQPAVLADAEAGDVPLGLAFTCMFAAVPGALVAAPFTVVLLAAFVSQVGGLQIAPVLIAVVTAYLTMEGVKYFVASRKAAGAAKGAADAPASDNQG
jgi:hypothetical protein